MTEKRIAFDFEKSMRNDPLKPGGIEGLKDHFWPIIVIMREEGLYLGSLPVDRSSLKDSFKFYVDEFTPLGWRFWCTVSMKFSEAVSRDGQVTPRKIANMRKNFEKLKAEFEAQQTTG
jgi:hypothetical protein